MRLSLDNTDGYTIRGYDAGSIRVNDRIVEHSVLLTPDRLEPWPVSGFDALDEGHFEALLALGPELVLFGSGTVLRFPHPALTRPLTDAGVGVETMDTAAACRTYNIVMAEGRYVAAALLL